VLLLKRRRLIEKISSNVAFMRGPRFNEYYTSFRGLELVRHTKFNCIVDTK
jgi:hypothetical protein